MSVWGGAGEWEYKYNLKIDKENSLPLWGDNDRLNEGLCKGL